MNHGLLFAQEVQQVSEPLFATWGWVAVAVLAAALFAWWLAKSRGARAAAILIAILSGMVALTALLVAGPVRGTLAAAASRGWSALTPLTTRPITWGILVGAVGVLLMMPRGSIWSRRIGAVIGVVGLGLLAAAVPLRLPIGERVLFWVLALVTVASAAATIAMRNAVYSAIWFAMSLLGTAALFLFQGAQFLGVATVVVYAGAIVVTFLFLVMLASPRGHAVYDRISWGWFPKIFSVATAAALVIVLSILLFQPTPQSTRWKVARALPALQDEDGRRLLEDDQLVDAQWVASDRVLKLVLRGNIVPEELPQLIAQIEEQLPAAVAEVDPEMDVAQTDLDFLEAHDDVLNERHMAHLGTELFSRHLVSVEAAGTVLLAALVGAVAIVSHGARRRDAEENGAA